MISNIRPDKIDYFLKPATASGEDENTVKNLWIKNFLIAGGITLGAVAIFLVRLLVFGFLSRVLLLFLCFAVVLDIYIVAKFIEVTVVRPKRYVKMVARYGRENLASQLSDTTAFGFFVDEDRGRLRQPDRTDAGLPDGKRRIRVCAERHCVPHHEQARRSRRTGRQDEERTHQKSIELRIQARDHDEGRKEDLRAYRSTDI